MRLSLWLAVAAGFVLRFGWLLLTQPEPVSDFAEYLALASGLADHGQLGYPEPSAYRLPLYPVLLSLFMLVSKNVFFLGLVNVLLSAGSVLLVHRLALRLFRQETIATVSAWVVALDLHFVFYAPILASEHLFALLVLGSMAVGAETSGEHPRRTAVMSGVLLGLATLTRGEGIFYLPVLAGLLFFKKTSLVPSRPKRLLVASLAVGCAVLVLVPWYVRNRIQVGPGAGLSTTGGLNFYYAHSEQYGYRPLYGTPFENQPANEHNAIGFEEGWNFIKEHPGSVFDSIVEGTRKLYEPDDSGVYWSTQTHAGGERVQKDFPLLGVWSFLSKTSFQLLEVMAILALFRLKPWTKKAAWVLGGILFANWLCYAVVFFGKPRYRWMAELAICMIAAVGVLNAHRMLLYLRQKIRERKKIRPGDSPEAQDLQRG